MKFSSSLLSLFALVSLVIASPNPAGFVVKDSLNAPQDWARRSVAPSDEHVVLHLGLAKRDQAGLEARLLEISDPDHKDYGEWLTADEVDAFTAPSAETRTIVSRWLEEHGLMDSHIEKRSVSENSISVTVPIHKARAMLGDAEFHVYEHRDTGEERITTESYSLPRDVAPHIETIFGLANFARGSAFRSPIRVLTEEEQGDDSTPGVVKTSSASGAPASCNFNYVTAHCLRYLYGTEDYKPYGKGQHIGISGFGKEYANFDDLQLYLKNQRKAREGYKFSVTTINGGHNTQSKPGAEANLDTQVVAGLAAPIRSTYYSTGGSPPFKADKGTPTNTNEPYAEQLDYLLGLTHPPAVLSTSYGDDEQTVPYAYAKRVCADFASLTARGVSILFASGDSGVGAASSCQTNDGLNTTTFLPVFPSTCPWVTSVGATMDFAPEVVAEAKESYITSGAGFSNYFARPSYQKTAVQGYLKTLGTENAGLYNTTGRAYPDVAAQGSRYKIYVGGKYYAVSGTSASTPTMASIIALLNDARLKAGKSTLGFLNPWIYSLNGKGFTDVTSGNSYGCSTDGFPATEGWDPATGFGTPKFKTLLSQALKK